MRYTAAGVQAQKELVVARLRRRLAGSAVVVTRGAEGMTIFDDGGDGVDVPIAGSEVFDVQGAGDTAITTLALATMAGGSLLEAAVLANACFFAAGNCGRECPSGVCHRSGIGPNRSIHASNSLAEVITVAAVNSRHERIGYSSQGKGMFEKRKPDIAAYSHIFGNFGPGRPGGTASRFDSGTSAATPVAAGVGALLLSAVPALSPKKLKRALVETATNVGQTIGWDRDFGHGVVNAAAAYQAVN